MESPRADLIKYLNIALERKYIFVLVALCIMTVSILGSYTIPKKYRAQSTIFIESNVIEQLIKGIAITPSMDARIKVLRDTMLSRSLVLNVLRKLDLDAHAENDKELEKLIRSFQKGTRINVKRNDLIIISYESTRPALARDYINKLVSEYVENNVYAKREEAYDATKFIRKQVDYFKGKVDGKVNKIIEFRQKQSIYFTLDEGSIIRDIKEFKKGIENIQIRKNELTATMKSIKEQLKDEKPFTTAMFSRDDVSGSIEALEKEMKYLLIKYTNNYPEVIRIKAVIQSLKNGQTSGSLGDASGSRSSEIEAANPIYQDLKQKTMSLEAEIKAINAKEQYLKELIDQKQENLRNIPDNKKKLADLEQERDSLRDVYEKLLMRMGQSEVSKQMEIEDKTTTFRIIESAILPRIPISPNRVRLIMLGIIMGIMGGYGVVFLIDYMSSSVKTLDTLKTFELPVLAIIPTMHSPEYLNKKFKNDLILYSLTGIYMLCILGVLTMEIMGITYVEDFMISITKMKQM